MARDPRKKRGRSWFTDIRSSSEIRSRSNIRSHSEYCELTTPYFTTPAGVYRVEDRDGPFLCLRAGNALICLPSELAPFLKPIPEEEGRAREMTEEGLAQAVNMLSANWPQEVEHGEPDGTLDGAIDGAIDCGSFSVRKVPAELVRQMEALLKGPGGNTTLN